MILKIIEANSELLYTSCVFILQYSYTVRGESLAIDSFQVFGKRKFGEIIDQSIGYSSYLDGFSLVNHG